MRDGLFPQVVRPGQEPDDRLLTPEQAAALLGVTVRWLYRHADDFTFTRRLSRKMLRFHEAGIRAYVERGKGLK